MPEWLVYALFYGLGCLTPVLCSGVAFLLIWLIIIGQGGQMIADDPTPYPSMEWHEQ